MEQQGRILDGDLETLGLSAALKMLALSGKTGVLRVVSGQEHLSIYLQNGHIIDLEEPDAVTPELVDMFCLLGIVPRDQVAALRQRDRENPGMAMQILAQWGLMTVGEMQHRTEFRIIQIVSRAVNWTRGHFEFHRDAISRQARSGALKPLNVDHILLEALRMADEWGRDAAGLYTRNTVARWMPHFPGDVNKLGFGREQMSVLCLSNGQFPLHAISYALLIPEPQVALIMQQLVEQGLVEVVDARMEDELERNLVTLISQSQQHYAQENGTHPEQRMRALIRTMGNCVNNLIAHHATYARVLRGRGELPRQETVRYLEATFMPIISRLHYDFPRMEGIVQFTDGKVDFRDLETLDKVVRGQELDDSYWDAVQFFSLLMRMIFDRILGEEVGKSRAGRSSEDRWAVFQQELDIDIERLAQRRTTARGQPERAARSPMPQPVEQPTVAISAPQGMAYAYDIVPDAWRGR